MPKPTNVNVILGFCEQNGDTAMKDVILEVLTKLGALQDKEYISKLSSPVDRTIIDGASAMVERADSDGDEDEDFVILNQLQDSL
ncbi:hypothetical protein OROMI_009548 [Orobanche minor]